MKKNDILLLICIIGIAIIFLLFQNIFTKQKGDFVEVSVDGTVIGTYSLNEDLDLIITGAAELNNHLVIKDHKADIIDADCPDRLCVHQKSISKTGEMLVCLPNKVIVEVVSAKDTQEVDAVAN